MINAVKVLVPIVLILVVLVGVVFSISHLLDLDELPELPPQPETASFFSYGDCKGFVITTGISSDFPARPGMDSTEQKATIDSILADAVAYGYKTVFFEATDGMSAFYASDILPSSAAYLENEGDFSFFDPLDYLCTQAAEMEIEVYALVSPYDGGVASITHHEDNPINSLGDSVTTSDNHLYLDPNAPEVTALAADICAELSRYALSGVVLTGIDDLPQSITSEQVENLLVTINTAMYELAGDSRHIGLVVQDAADEGSTGISPDLVTRLMSDGILNIILPVLDITPDNTSTSYESALNTWAATVGDSDARMVALFEIDDYSQSMQTVDYNMFITSLHSAVSGAVFDDYSRIKTYPDQSERLMSYLFETTPPPTHDLSISTELAVGNPAGSSVTLSNDYTKYYITGTSDPTQELLVNGAPIERYTYGGGWGVSVPLSVGQNTFTFTQGDKSTSVTLVRSQAATPTAISTITENSIFPTQNLAYNAGDALTISCTAPAGGSVSATINGVTLQMTQTAAASMAGIPATFTATYTIPADASPSQVSSIGKVTYTLNYGGNTSNYTSKGDVLVAGSGVPILAEVTAQMAGIYTNTSTVSDFITSLVTGSTLRLSGDYSGSRAETPDGGFVPLDSIKILTGENPPTITYSDITLQKSDGAEQFIFEGKGLGRYEVNHTDTALTVTLHDTTFERTDYSTFESDIFSSIAVENLSDGSAHLTLTPTTQGGLWGWDFTLNEHGQAVLYCKTTPTLSDTYARPLEGIHIMVDPGHGGTDPGALGSAGENGPHEHTLNMAVSDILRYRLEQLGATVTMTRGDDSVFINLIGRVDMAAALRPDLFLSVHHNSTALTTDATNIDYATAFYCFGISERLADATLQNLYEATGREIKAADHAAYYVTRMSYAPSVLFEVGFLSNPAQQEQCADQATVYKTACALADAVVQSFE